jgi:hypothetical protein
MLLTPVMQRRMIHQIQLCDKPAKLSRGLHNIYYLMTTASRFWQVVAHTKPSIAKVPALYEYV